jgi:hypothetical protein
MKITHGYMRIVLLVIFAFTTVVSFQQFTKIRTVGTFPDTSVYMSAAHAPLFSPEIWTGQRAPGYPLFIRQSYDSTTDIARNQYLLSFACWAFLAFCCLRVLTNPLAKVLGFTLVLTQILSPGVFMWHKVMLSESVSFSLLAACVGCWLLFAHRQSLLTAAFVVISTAIWVGVRDTNAYQALFIGVLLILVVVYRTLRKPAVSLRQQRLVLGVAAFMFIIFVGSDLSSNRGQRYMFPFFNNIAQRILPSEERTAWFAAKGMPVTPALVERSGKWASSDDFAFFNDDALEGFREWSRRHGKSIYVKWLVSHPKYTFYEAARGFTGIFDTIYAEYAPSGFYPPGPPPYTLGSAAAVLYAFIFGLLMCYCLWPFVYRSEIARVGMVIVPLMMLPSVLLGHMTVWHGDTMEITRHSAQTVLQLKIALCLLAACAVDQAMLSRKARAA